MTEEKYLELCHRFERVGAKRCEPGSYRLWNGEWERQYQYLLKKQYEEAQEKGVFTGVYKIYCAGCREEFYTTVPTKKYCNYRTCGMKVYKLRQRVRRWKERRDTVCLECGKLFTPSRSDAKYCCSACRQKAYRSRKASSQSGNLPQA